MVDRIDEMYEIDSMICIPVWKRNQRSGEVEIAGVLQCLIGKVAKNLKPMRSNNVKESKDYEHDLDKIADDYK